MAPRRRTFRAICGPLAAGLAIGLAVGACSGSPAPANPSAPSGGGYAGDSGDAGAPLTTGLAANLDKLVSYQFTETILSSSAGSSGPLVLSGTVVNTPSKSIWIKTQPAQYIVIGDQAWRSYDGSTWTIADPTDTLVTDLLPGHDYATWFDAKADRFRDVGDETKNDVPCIHYKGDASLASLYTGTDAASGIFLAEVWIAKDGNYPVSGTYGFVATAGATGAAATTATAAPAAGASASGAASPSGAATSRSWGFSFDITHVNSLINSVDVPTHVVAIPT
jgi:hypothetical protein